MRHRKNRKQIMQAVRSENTTPEMVVRRALFSAGLRYRLHCRNLPGTPDLFILKFGVVVLVNGCFWHQHGCRFTNRPKSNSDFWNNKFDNNMARDVKVLQKLSLLGFRVAVIWECSLKQNGERVLERLIDFIRSDEEFVEI
ncbi:very short patch repair endonuclease [uncultured Fibrobacter sp.]|uniref:very short patch repair endonuclease n=1 Tax=uncultured Fibrobacter sp. TaxID=261512 RepID=UPI0028040EFF|nr:very short patch repair endonuclease [uncultured Fibrobacter sp.]